MFDTVGTRQAAFGYGFQLFRVNWVYPDGSVGVDNRSYIWANYGATIPNPYYEANHVANANALMIEQFKWRGA